MWRIFAYFFSFRSTSRLKQSTPLKGCRSRRAYREGRRERTVSLAPLLFDIQRLTDCASVGIGSNFDRIGSVPVGLEGVAKCPYLVRQRVSSHFLFLSKSDIPSQVVELYARSWTRQDLVGFAGETSSGSCNTLNTSLVNSS